MKDRKELRLSFALGLVGAASAFLSAAFAIVYSVWRSGNVTSLPFGETQAIGWYSIGGLCLAAGLLALFGCIKGKMAGSIAMFIAGALVFVALHLNGWFAVIFLFSGGYFSARETWAALKNSERQL